VPTNAIATTQPLPVFLRQEMALFAPAYFEKRLLDITKFATLSEPDPEIDVRVPPILGVEPRLEARQGAPSHHGDQTKRRIHTCYQIFGHPAPVLKSIPSRPVYLNRLTGTLLNGGDPASYQRDVSILVQQGGALFDKRRLQ